MSTSKKLTMKLASAGAAFLISGLSMAGTSLFSAEMAHADTISDEAQFVKRINEARVAGGLKELAVHVALVDAGRGWATKMRDTSVAAGVDDCLISHNPNLRTAVNAPWRKLGENVGCGDTDADALHEAFMNSPKHRENIMDPTFDSVGIGIVMAGDTMFVTEQFMQIDQKALNAATNPAVPNALALKGPHVDGVSQLAAPAPGASSASKKAPAKTAKKSKTKRVTKAKASKKTAAPATKSPVSPVAKAPSGTVSF
jgi:Cysteine-rich secretory protein family